ncbi:MAG: hypothetical protein DMG30_23115 [Acidobacteria bacterium]|nr:MAG: hypothetical protein DMG30_23115 [Acidobacteriota bacterium]
MVCGNLGYLQYVLALGRDSLLSGFWLWAYGRPVQVCFSSLSKKDSKGIPMALAILRAVLTLGVLRPFDPESQNCGEEISTSEQTGGRKEGSRAGGGESFARTAYQRETEIHGSNIAPR